MARMIHVSEFADQITYRRGEKTSSTGLPATWYFADAYHDNRNDFAVRFTVESSYPFSCAIHEDTIQDSYSGESKGAFRVEMRRWIERNMEGDVVVKTLDKSYRVTPPANEYNPYPDTREVRHKYVVFHFETEADLFHFRLRWSEQVEAIQDTHPRRNY